MESRAGRAGNRFRAVPPLRTTRPDGPRAERSTAAKPGPPPRGTRHEKPPLADIQRPLAPFSEVNRAPAHPLAERVEFVGLDPPFAAVEREKKAGAIENARCPDRLARGKNLRGADPSEA